VCVYVCWHPIAPGSCPVPNEIKKHQKNERLKKKRELEIDKKEEREDSENGI